MFPATFAPTRLSSLSESRFLYWCQSRAYANRILIKSHILYAISAAQRPLCSFGWHSMFPAIKQTHTRLILKWAMTGSGWEVGGVSCMAFLEILFGCWTQNGLVPVTNSVRVSYYRGNDIQINTLRSYLGAICNSTVELKNLWESNILWLDSGAYANTWNESQKISTSWAVYT